MFNGTIDDILKYFYNSIDEKKLYEDKIVVDEDNLHEDSKNIYLQKFAKFLNDSAYKGYKISSSIISKLLKVIEYDGYQDQIIDQYADILNTAMRNEYIKEPPANYLDPMWCIDYVNKYIASDYDKVVSYDESSVFIIENYKYLLQEIKDPTPIVINDIQEWINSYSQK